MAITVDGVAQSKPVPRFDSYCTYHRLATLSIAEGVAADEEHVAVTRYSRNNQTARQSRFDCKILKRELKAEKYQGTRMRLGQVLVLGDVLE